MDFDLQTIWTASGAAAAAVVVGFLFGFLQSAIPAVTASGAFRNWALIGLSAGIVLLAAATSGKTLDDPNVVGNVFGGLLVFIGIYNAAKNAHGAGEATALRTVDSASPISTAVPDPDLAEDTVTDEATGG